MRKTERERKNARQRERVSTERVGGGIRRTEVM